MATEFLSGNRLTLLRSGVEYFPALEKAIGEATSEIFLETYIFEGDSTGKRIAQALCEAGRRGVTVRVLVDGFGSKVMPGNLQEDLREAGVKLLVFRPEIWNAGFRRDRLRRMHRKIAVADARVAFVGGINIIDDMHTPRQTPPRYDYAVKVEGPLLGSDPRRSRAAVELGRARQSRARLAHQPSAPAPPRRPLDPAPSVAPGRPARGARRARQRPPPPRHRGGLSRGDPIGEAGDRHRERLLSSPGSAFATRSPPPPRAACAWSCCCRGGSSTCCCTTPRARSTGRCSRRACEIYEYHRSFMHAKVAVIDEHWATVGSSNIDPFSLLLAREANIVGDDRRIRRRAAPPAARGHGEGGARRGEDALVQEAPVAAHPYMDRLRLGALHHRHVRPGRAVLTAPRPPG